MKISFGMIVFNALSILPKGMLGACIENVYDIAHEILISEGAVRPFGGNNGNASWATKDGRSTDGTLEFLRKFPDPEKKIKIFTKDDDFWDGKLEMCNAYITSMTGDYIWQLDSDEFYLKSDMQKIKQYLTINSVDEVDFYANHFFGDFDHCCDEKQRGWANVIPWRRIFKHNPGDKWISHAPPIYGSHEGRNNILSRETTLMMGIKMYHYGYVNKTQAEFKKRYYSNPTIYNAWKNWIIDHNYEILHGDRSLKFVGNHPKIIKKIK